MTYISENREYQGLSISKKESEWIEWYQKGSNDFWDAFYEYQDRKTQSWQSKKALSWFNVVLKKLKQKELFTHVPYAFYPSNGIYWVHPGFMNNGNFRTESNEIDMPEYLLEKRNII